MNYNVQKRALEHALENASEPARVCLRVLTTDELDKLIDALDWLAAYADAEAIHRAEKRA